MVGLINRCSEILATRRQSCCQHRSESNSVRLWIRKCLLLPATFGQHCQDPVGWGTIPPRWESLLLVLYLIMNIVFMFPGYDLFPGNLWYVDRYHRDR